MRSRYNRLRSGNYLRIWQYLTLVLFGFLTIFETKAQCTGSMGDPVLNQTFGTDNYRFPASRTSYTIVGGCPNAAGTYTINDFLFGCGPNSWVQMVGDHTPNDLNGNYMLVNASNNPGTVYQDTAKSLCGNTTYVFGIWVTPVMNSFACGGNAVLPNVKFAIKSLSGTILVQDSTGNLPIVQEKQWKYYTMSLTTGAGATDLIVSVTINPPNGCGAAFAIDDITLSPCSPSTITAALNGSTAPVDVCADYTDVWILNGSYTPGFNNPTFQWQSSIDTGRTWVDIAGETSLSYQPPHRTSGIVLYRICIAENGNMSSISCRVASNAIHTGVYPVPVPVPPQVVRGCLGKDFTFPPSDPSALQFLWTGPNGYSSANAIGVIPNVQYNDTGMYRLKETFYYGCILYDTFYLKVFPGTTVTVQPVYSICEGESEMLFATATDSVGYSWSPGTGLSNNTIANPVAAPKDSIVYKVVTTNRYGCQDSAYVDVNVYRNPLADAGPDKAVLVGDTAVLNGLYAGTQTNFYWTPSANMSNATILDPAVYPLQSIIYTLHVESTVGCGTTTDNVEVKVFNDLYIPNAFTPNNDGKNDKLRVTAFDNYRLISFLIFNRWGENVYKSVNNYDGWDGKFKGMLQPAGVYVYHLVIQAPAGRKIVRKGTIVLIR